MLARHGCSVVVDTGVFGADLVTSKGCRVTGYEPFLAGEVVGVSFATVAELRFGARHARWGSRRTRRLADLIRGAAVLWPDRDLTEVYADFRLACVRRGHPLGQQIHEADRWIAATAILLGVPLVSHDRVFLEAPGLRLRTTLSGREIPKGGAT